MEKVITSKMGETFVIRQRSAQTNGQFIEIDIQVDPNQHHRPLHVHPNQTEYFKVLEGTISLQVNEEIRHLQVGDELTILPNTPHYYWNNHNTKATVKTRLSPALNFEDFLLTITGLEKEVAIDNRGVPANKLIAAQFVNRFKNIMRPADVPAPVVMIIFPVLSFLSYVMGNRLPKTILMVIGMLALMHSSFAQSSFPRHQLSINAFRNPSIGIEYQQGALSVHGGYYVTNFASGVTTKFLKTGLTFWFLPVDKKPMPSSFYIGASFLRGLNQEYKNKNAFALETGFRWYVWKGLNFRLGVIGLTANGYALKINPTPSVSYSFKF